MLKNYLFHISTKTFKKCLEKDLVSNKEPEITFSNNNFQRKLNITRF